MRERERYRGGGVGMMWCGFMQYRGGGVLTSYSVTSALKIYMGQRERSCCDILQLRKSSRGCVSVDIAESSSDLRGRRQAVIG